MEKYESSPDSNLVKLRRQLGITQKQIAIALEVTEQTVANWERGRAIPRLTIPQMKILCKLLQCSLDELPDNLGPENKNAEASI